MVDPVKLAAWMVRFWFVDQDLFEVDPVRYQKALGEEGLDRLPAGGGSARARGYVRRPLRP